MKAGRKPLWIGSCLVGGILWLQPLAFSAPATFTCDRPEWRDLPNEARVLKDHREVAKRQEKSLKLNLNSGKALEFEDEYEGEEPGGAYQLHRIISVGPKEEWVTLFEPGSESFGYRVVHRKSGKTEELGGCPLWSPDGHYFVALHEDLESGMTKNEASLWYCADPGVQCEKIWSSSNGGRQAHWSGKKAQILLSKLDMDQKGQPEVVQAVHCAPQKAKANCQVPKTWKKP